MSDPASNPQLLHSLGKLARGLSALFWGLPICLVVCVQTAKSDQLRPLGVFPPLFVTGLLFYGLSLLGHFQKQERIWMTALDRARIFALVNMGLSPFIYWWSKLPTNPFYSAMLDALIVSGLLFLFTLNPVLRRLSAMLPDEMLRQETRLFTTVNRYLLLGTLALMALHFALTRLSPQSLDTLFGSFLENSTLRGQVAFLLAFFERGGLWIVLFLVLLPLAMTMALTWKIKEVILASVFGPEQP